MKKGKIAITFILLVCFLVLAGCTSYSFEGTVTSIDHYLKDLKVDRDKVYVRIMFDNGMVIEELADAYYRAVKKGKGAEVGKSYLVSYKPGMRNAIQMVELDQQK